MLFSRLPSHSEPIMRATCSGYFSWEGRGNFCIFRGLVWTAKIEPVINMCAYRFISTYIFEFLQHVSAVFSSYSTRTPAKSWGPTVSLWSSQLLSMPPTSVQTAQLEEGGKGEVHTMNCRARGELTRLWHAYGNGLADFMLTCFCMICLVNNSLELGTPSIDWC